MQSAALSLLAAALCWGETGESKIEVGTEPGKKIPQFTARLHFPNPKEKTADLDSHKSDQVTVYFTVGVKCGATPRYVDRIRDLEKTYSAKKVSFIFIYPNKTESDEEKASFHAENKWGGAYVLDAGGAIAKKLDGKSTSEAFVCDKSGTILYRGGIDDNPNASKVEKKYLAAALDEALAGKKVTTPTSKVFG